MTGRIFCQTAGLIAQPRVFIGVGTKSRTRDLLITNQLLADDYYLPVSPNHLFSSELSIFQRPGRH